MAIKPKKINYDVAIKSTNHTRSYSLPPEVYTSDTAVQFRFNILDVAAAEFTEGGAVTTVEVTTRDGSFFQHVGETSLEGTTVVYDLKEAEGNHAGLAKIQLKINLGGDYFTSDEYEFKILNSIATGVPVEIYVQNWDTLTSQAEAYITQMAQDIEEFDVALETGVLATNIAAKLIELQTTYAPDLLSVKNGLEQAATKAELSGVASPLVATLVSQMTNTSRIYVYKGSEGGYTNGNWYYHNGTSWVSGGVYQASGIAEKSVSPDMLKDVRTNTSNSGNFIHLTDSVEAKLQGIAFDAITGTPTSVKVYVAKKNLAKILYQSPTQNVAGYTAVQIDKSSLKKGKTYTASFDTENTGYNMWLKWNGGQVYFAMDGTHKVITFNETADWKSDGAFVLINTVGTGNCGAITNLMLVEGNTEAPYEAYQGASITVTGTTLAELNNVVLTLYPTLKTYENISNIWCHDATTLITITYAQTINSVGEYDDTAIQEFLRNRFKGKKWVSYGDSLTQAGNNLENPSYQYYVHNYFEFGTHVGAGVGGSQMCNNGAAQYKMFINPDGSWTGKSAMAGDAQPEGSTAINSCMCNWERINAQIPSDADVVFVFGGANDGSSGFATWHLPDATWVAGSMSDPAWGASAHYATYGGDYKISEFKSAIASTIMKIQCKAPNALIIFCTVAKTKGVTGQNYTDIYNNPSAYDEQLIADFTLQTTRRMGVPCIDLYGTSGINNINRATYVADVIHPNSEGKKLLGRAIVSGLKPILGKYV